MRKYIIPLICYITIILIVINIDSISNYLSKKITNTHQLTIADANEYKKEYDFMYVQNSKDYIPYSYTDLINIVYSIINNGWEEFTFYCPNEYNNCIKDISSITKDEMILTHINNFVHPYNSFNTLSTSITDSGAVNIMVKYLYTKEQMDVIEEYTKKIINDLYKSQDDDYENLKRIHDYIINHVKYDTLRNDTGESNYLSYIAYGPIVNGYATCNGYADLMAIILSKLNYKNYKIATTKEEISYESNGHVWNAVKIDDSWLHLDLTWDDPVSSDGKNYLYHKYFLVDNEELTKADSGTVSVEEHNFNKAIYQEFMD